MLNPCLPVLPDLELSRASPLRAVLAVIVLVLVLVAVVALLDECDLLTGTRRGNRRGRGRADRLLAAQGDGKSLELAIAEHRPFDLYWIAGLEAAFDLRAGIALDLHDQTRAKHLHLIRAQAFEPAGYFECVAVHMQLKVRVVCSRAIDHACGCASGVDLVRGPGATLGYCPPEVYGGAGGEVAAKVELLGEAGGDFAGRSGHDGGTSIETRERADHSESGSEIVVTLLGVFWARSGGRAVNYWAQYRGRRRFLC
jgi:hypothetical protein